MHGRKEDIAIKKEGGGSDHPGKESPRKKKRRRPLREEGGKVQKGGKDSPRGKKGGGGMHVAQQGKNSFFRTEGVETGGGPIRGQVRKKEIDWNGKKKNVLPPQKKKKGR